MYLPSRRLHSSLLLLMVLVAACLTISPACAQVFKPSYSRIDVDISALKRQGNGPFADFLGAAVREGAVEALAREGAAAGQGPRLLIRLTGVSFSAFSEDDWGGGASDGLEGEIIVLGPKGQVLSSRPQVFKQSSSAAGPWYVPDSERRRAELLGRNFGAWAVKQ